MSVHEKLIVVLLVSVASAVLPSMQSTLSLTENELVLPLDGEMMVVQTRGNVFYVPLMAKVNATEMQQSQCYHNPLWNTTVLPVNVHLWRQDILDRVETLLMKRRSSVCSTTGKEVSTATQTSEVSTKIEDGFCGKNVTVSPLTTSLIYLESDFPHFVALAVDFSHRRFPPQHVSFAVAVPPFSNCSEIRKLFNETSFLNTIYFVAHRNDGRVEREDVNEVRDKQDGNVMELWLTNTDIFEAVSQIVGENNSASMNMSRVKFVRQDYVSILASRLSAMLLRNVSLNFANAEMVRDKTYSFLCPKKETVATVMSLVESKSEAYPDGTTTLLAGLRGLLYCRVPTIAWLKSYTSQQAYRLNPYGQYETIVRESDNKVKYLKFSLRRVYSPMKVRLPLSLL